MTVLTAGLHPGSLCKCFKIKYLSPYNYSACPWWLEKPRSRARGCLPQSRSDFRNAELPPVWTYTVGQEKSASINTTMMFTEFMKIPPKYELNKLPQWLTEPLLLHTATVPQQEAALITCERVPMCCIVTDDDKAEWVTSMRSWSFFFPINNKRINKNSADSAESSQGWHERHCRALSLLRGWQREKQPHLSPVAKEGRARGRAEQMAGRSRGKVCKSRKELREWEHTGKGSGSRCIRVPRFPNGFSAADDQRWSQYP